jgi:hypothetical protein
MFAIFLYGILLVVATKDRNLFADLAKESPPPRFLGTGPPYHSIATLRTRMNHFIIIEKYI